MDIFTFGLLAFAVVVLAIGIGRLRSGRRHPSQEPRHREQKPKPRMPAASGLPPNPHRTPATTNSLANLLDGTYRLVAVDVETANADTSSICQIGMALVDTTGHIETVSLLIDPEDDFDDFNIGLHGIDPEIVAGEPNFTDAMDVLRTFLDRHPLIQHSTFDKRAFDGACKRYGLPRLRAKWHDSVVIARKAWPELTGNGGHGLASLKDYLSLDFHHHDAGEDAKAAAQVVLLAEKQTGQTFVELTAPRRRTVKSFEASVAIEGNQNGPLYGHVACFTGKLTLSRPDASQIAANAGITVRTGMSKKITLLVVGDQDMSVLAGHNKSTKHRRAEELIEQGHEIRIIGETEFLALTKPG